MNRKIACYGLGLLITSLVGYASAEVVTATMNTYFYDTEGSCVDCVLPVAEFISTGGDPNPSIRGICWSTSHDCTDQSPLKFEQGPGTGIWGAIIEYSALIPGTTYYTRSYAVTNAGVGYGNELSFTTPGTPPPALATMNTYFYDTEGSCENCVLPVAEFISTGGDPNPSIRGICWGTSHDCTDQSPLKFEQGPGTGIWGAIIEYSMLTPGATYYTRSYAITNAGIGYGNELTFMVPSQDADGDGVPDSSDACPGFNDNVDSDTDGTPDGCDACPQDAFGDSDGDASCDSADPCPFDPANDADGDTVCGNVDTCPFDADNDIDSDGVCGNVDICPLDAFNDADGDGVCGNVDVCLLGNDNTDNDGDGTADACDICPLDAANDADGDGVCGNVDVCPNDFLDDSDGDGACDSADSCPLDAANDADADGVCGDVDACPADWQNDADGDGICESTDNCATVSNSDQSDADVDGIGNACEPDVDGDGVIDDNDNCKFISNANQTDTNLDGVGDACEPDTDQDGIIDDMDACPATASGTLVNATGCSIAQLVPCGNAWKNHGAYVSSVSRAANSFLNAGLITSAQKDAIVSAAAQSSCGQ